MRFQKRTIWIASLLATGAIAYVTLQPEGRASASSTSSAASQGLSPAAAATAAIADAHEGIAPGELALRVGTRGTVGRIRSVLDAEDGVEKATSSGKASCFPGMPCTAAEIEQHEEQLRKWEATEAYLVEMSGSSFTPPTIHLRPGHSASPGEVETVVVDASTGALLERVINNTHPDVESLGPVTEMTATIPDKSSAEAAAYTAAYIHLSAGGTHGKIVGHVSGSGSAHLEVIVSEGAGGSLRDTRVVRRTTTSSKGNFAATDMLPGSYSVGVDPDETGLKCSGKRVLVHAGKTTKITIVCKASRKH